jgi:hypothetical protein
MHKTCSFSSEAKKNFTHIYRIVEMLRSWIKIDYMNCPAHSLAVVVQTGAIS